MQAGIFFTGSGPILLLTSFKNIMAPELIEKLISKGIHKFLCFEVPVDLVKERYGNHFNVILGDLQQQDDLRVLDFNGPHVLKTFSFREIKGPHYYEQPPEVM